MSKTKKNLNYFILIAFSICQMVEESWELYFFSDVLSSLANARYNRICESENLTSFLTPQLK